MIVSIQIGNAEIFAFIVSLVFKLMSRKVLFINREDNSIKSRLLFKKTTNFTGKLPQNYKIVGMRNFQDTFEIRK